MIKSIAIVGAGLSGLATCRYLLTLCPSLSITVFDTKKIGEGSALRFSGLLHPYVGAHGNCSLYAREALSSAKELLEFIGPHVYRKNGIVRHIQSEKQRSNLEKMNDVQFLDQNRALILSGITVFTPLYLQGLWESCEKDGAVFRLEKINSLSELETFDASVISAGSGLLDLVPSLPFKLVKGQVLKCQTESFERSEIGKGHLAISEKKDICFLGSTYEHRFSSIDADQKTCETYLKKRISTFLPSTFAYRVIECLSGLRVVNKQSYLPKIVKIGVNQYVIGAMGSRGLLYHSYFGKMLAKMLLI